MLPERAGRPPLLGRASHCARGAFQVPGFRGRARGMMLWSSCFPQAPSIRSRPSRHRRSHSLGGRKEKREGAGKARRREEERWGGRERRGRESLPFAVPPPLLSGWWRLGSPSTPSPSSSPPSPPTLLPSLPPSFPSVQEGSCSLRAAQGAGGGAGGRRRRRRRPRRWRPRRWVCASV